MWKQNLFKAASLRVHDSPCMIHYKTFEGKVDLAVLFIERTMELLNSGPAVRDALSREDGLKLIMEKQQDLS